MDILNNAAAKATMPRIRNHAQISLILLMAVYCSTAFAQQVVMSGQTVVSGQVNIGGPSGPTIIIPQPIIVSPATLPSGLQSTAYSYQVLASNGTPPYSFSITLGTLPTGLTMPASGLISGTPSVAGTSTFTVKVTDANSQTATQQFQLVISSSLTITTTSLPAGTASTAYSTTLAASGGTAPYTWLLASGNLPTGFSFSGAGVLSGTTTQTGSFSLTFQATDNVGAIVHTTLTLTINPIVVSSGADNRYCNPSNQVINLPADGPVATPMTQCFYTPLAASPSPGTVRTTTAANFQTTYNAASCGDVINVTAGTSFTGTWTLNKVCTATNWITIQGSGVSNVNFPPEGTRTSPCWSNVASLPNRPAYPCVGGPLALTAQIVTPLASNGIKINGAAYHRIIAIEVTRVATHGQVFGLVDMSNNTPQSSHIIFDRVWFHGINQDGNFPLTPSTDTGTTRAIYLGQSNFVALIDSYVSDIYNDGGTSANTDAQMIGGGVGGLTNTGWGVYKVVNNHCEGSSEGCIILGGSGGPPLTPPGCTFGLNCNIDVPTNVEVRRNLSFAPNSWNGNTTTINATGWPNRKNGVEFKTGANILLEANVFENCWYSSQPYCYVFDFAPKNQSSGGNPNLPTCPSCLVQDFVARYNYGYNYAGPAIAIYSTMDAGCSTCSTLGRRGSVHDNLVGDKLNRGSLPFTGFDGMELLADAGPMTKISVRHNTIVNAYRSAFLIGSSTAGNSTSGFDQVTVQDNIATYTSSSGGSPWLAGNGSTSGTCDLVSQSFTTFLNTCINGTTATWTVDHNFIFGTSTLTGWPSGNTPEATAAAMGFTNYNSGDSSLTPSNYALTGGSPGHLAASDGSDVGANITQLGSEITGVDSY